MTTPPNAPEVDVLALLTPAEGEIIEPSMWDYSRTVARKNTTIDVSDDVFLMRQSAMVHCYTHTLRVMGDRPRVALLPADDLDEARSAVAELLTREAALVARNADLEQGLASACHAGRGLSSICTEYRKQLEAMTAERDALAAEVGALRTLHAAVLKHGEWDDGCFYYAGRSASELEHPLALISAAVRAEAGT